MMSLSPTAAAGHPKSLRLGRPLDEESFKSFAPFLRASQEYSELSGCRFRCSSFQRENSCSEGRPGVEARLRAAPVVHEFAERLRGGDAALLEELDRAFRLVMAESVRNSIMSTCQQLGVFPPSPEFVDVGAEDCAYEDVSESLPVIAQRLYHDQARRGTAVGVRLGTRALTAAYIVDFAAEIGVPLPEMPETQALMLQEFASRVAEWEAQKEPLAQEHVRGNRDLRKWWEESVQAVAAANVAAMAAQCVGLGRRGSGGLKS